MNKSPQTALVRQQLTLAMDVYSGRSAHPEGHQVAQHRPSCRGCLVIACATRGPDRRRYTLPIGVGTDAVALSACHRSGPNTSYWMS